MNAELTADARTELENAADLALNVVEDSLDAWQELARRDLAEKHFGDRSVTGTLHYERTAIVDMHPCLGALNAVGVGDDPHHVPAAESVESLADDLATINRVLSSSAAPVDEARELADLLEDLETEDEDEDDGGDGAAQDREVCTDGGRERPENCECPTREVVEGVELLPCAACAIAGFDSINPNPPADDADGAGDGEDDPDDDGGEPLERPSACRCGDLVTGEAPCAECAAAGFETRPDAGPQPVADGGRPPRFDAGDLVMDTERDDEDDGRMVVLDPDVGVCGEVEFERGGEVFTIAEADEDADEGERAVRCVFVSWLEANVTGWREVHEDAPARFYDALRDYCEAWSIPLQTYDYREGRLERAAADEVIEA